MVLPPQSWSDLPHDLTGLVLGRLPAHADRVRSAAVCRQWRAAVREVPLPPPMPLLAIPDGTAYSLPLHTPLRFPACAGYAAASVSSTGNWLLFISPIIGDYGRCFLRDPFSGATLLLPSLSRIWWRDHKRPDGSVVDRRCTASATPLTVKRLLLCSPDLIAAHVRLQLKTRIAVCKPGAASCWTVFMDDDGLAPFLGTMAFHQSKLFAIGNRCGNLYVIDVAVDEVTRDPWVSRVWQVIHNTVLPYPSRVWPQDIHDPLLPYSDIIVETMFSLVESRGSLLMVRRGTQKQWAQLGGGYVPTGSNKLEVFEADLQACRWTQVATVGDDRVLFLSGHHCRSFCVSQLGMPGDRVVVFENDDEGCCALFGKDRTSSCIVYNIRDRKVDVTLLPNAFRWKCGAVQATWLFPKDWSTGEAA